MPRSPSSGPLYSNVGFNLLGMALESVYGTSYENIIQRMILDPLGMENTTFKMPDQTENAFLPGPEEHWLLGDYGNFNPTGGLWSTTNDITTFMRAIASSKLLSPVRTREWLRGLSVTSSLHQLVGAPWELYRPDNLDITFQRPIDIYTKAGYVEGYGSYAVFVPEYDLTISILAAGNSAHQASRSLLQEVTKKLIPLADQITRKEAEVKYGGKYSGNDNGINVTVTLDDGPGLALTYWKMNWQDILAYLPQVAGLGDNGKTISARIYPTDPDSLDTDKHFWQIHMSVPQPESDWADMDCMTWQEMDKLRYIREPLDAAYFVMEGPVAKAVHFPGWRMTLERLEGMPSGAIEIIPDA